MARHDTNYLRSLFDDLRFASEEFAAFRTKRTAPDHYRQVKKFRDDYIRERRRRIREYYSHISDPLEESLLSGACRTVWKKDGDLSDGPTYFWIDPDPSLTDEEIDDIRENETLRCRSPYDCCGQQFTWSFTVHRTPVGVAFINRTAFDY